MNRTCLPRESSPAPVFGGRRRWSCRQRLCRHADRRGAFSLLEVVLSLVILAAALATIGELLSIGTRNARSARDLSVAQLLCESKLAELAAGLAPLAASQNVAFTSDPQEFGHGWLYSVAIEPLDDLGLVAVQVQVVEEGIAGRPLEFTLTRWLHDPQATIYAETPE